MRIKNYLWIAPFISFLLGYLIFGKLFEPKIFSTPSIVGKKLLQAVSILSDYKLNIRFIAQKEDPDLPTGTILSQKPLAGRKIKPNQTVFVVVSTKPPKVPCPYLINRPLDSINQTLENKNIRNKSYFLASNHPKNNCISQHPSPTTPLRENNVITYVSSGNKKPVILPKFKHKDLASIIKFLQKWHEYIEFDILNFSSKKLEQLEHDQYIIIDQRPLAGSIVNLDNQKKLKIHLKIVKRKSTPKKIALNAPPIEGLLPAQALP